MPSNKTVHWKFLYRKLGSVAYNHNLIKILLSLVIKSHEIGIDFTI